MRHRVSARLAAVTIGLSAGLVPVAASTSWSATPRPDAPVGLRVVLATPSSFTITSKPAAHAQKYKLYASTLRSNLFTGNIRNALHSAWRSTPRLTISGLQFTMAPYYYRMEAMNGQRTKFSAAIGEVGLKPPTPTGLTATANQQRSDLTWNASTSATGYQIERASNPAMTSNVKIAKVLGNNPQYTPLNLHDGSTYYFRIRAMNVSTPSSWSSTVPLTSHVNTFDVRVMTFNILEASNAGVREGDGPLKPWSVRKPAVVRTINTAHPDVIGVQEAASFVGSGQERQVDSLHAALPGYGLAFTEVLPGTPGWHRTGNYILFNKTTFGRVGDGGHWSLGDSRWAAWQVLRNNATGAKFLFVDAHLLPTSGRAGDVKRRQETQTLLSSARSEAASAGGLPIAYVGDFNSDQYRHHVFNAPSIVMQNADIADAYQAAQKRVRGAYNTANGNLRRPPRNAAHIDAVFAPPGVGVRTWELQLRLSHGKFVGVIPSDHNALVSDLTIPYS